MAFLCYKHLKMEEIWKDVIGYEGRYQISNYGRLKSIKKKESILRGSISKEGYIQYTLNWAKHKKYNVYLAHQLVAIGFLNHKPCGMNLVVDHINDDKKNNLVTNLQVVTNRFNSRKTQGTGTSMYKGVSWSKQCNKWLANIAVNGKNKYLGLFENEYDAHLAYQKALKEL